MHGPESVFIGFAIHKIINWNPESTTAAESGIQDVESGIQDVESKMWNPESKE
jgi:hypothetical protein